MTVNPVINIVIPQGADFSEVFTSTESDGSLSNLSGYSGASKLKKHSGATVAYNFTVGINTSSSEVSIAMTAPVTTTLEPGRYYYDVVLTAGSGGVSRMVEGFAIVTAGIAT